LDIGRERGEIIINGKNVGMGKEEVVVYVNVLSQYSPGDFFQKKKKKNINTANICLPF